MKKIFKTIFNLIRALAIIGGLIFCFIVIFLVAREGFREMKYDIEHPIYYEYIDLDGNIGETNNWCSYKSYHNGMGGVICKLDDGTIIQVKQYQEKRRES